VAGTRPPGSDLPDSTFQVDFQSLRDAVASLDAAATRFAQALNDHVAGQAALYQSWSGSARDKQLAKHGEWLYAAWSMANVVKRTHEALDQISKNYEQQEDGFVKMWTPAPRK